MTRSIPASAIARAPAKINLYLEVGPLREDGFHELVTVYQAIDRWETVTLTESDEDVITVSGPGAESVPTGSKNLAYRAVDLLRREANSDMGFAIHIEKNIPVAGGMAGGSADAAAALVAANHVLRLGLSRDELEERAARLGSDVPFCVRGGTAIGTGRGEQLVTVLHDTLVVHLVAVTAGEGLSTPEVFAELDRLRDAAGTDTASATAAMPPIGGCEAVVEAIAQRDIAALAAAAGNDLGAAAQSLRPELRRTLSALESLGSIRELVSGSGPTCLGIFADHDAALDAAAGLAELGLGREIIITTGPVSGARLDNAALRM